MRRMIAAGVFVATAVATSYITYRLVSDNQLRETLLTKAKTMASTTRSTVDAMSEEVALRTAQMTRNPKINQEWVAHQWESVGY